MESGIDNLLGLPELRSHLLQLTHLVLTDQCLCVLQSILVYEQRPMSDWLASRYN
jgi:hypothetical protein